MGAQLPVSAGAVETEGIERALLERVCARDVRAFELLYRRYEPRLSRFLRKLLWRPHLTEEVLSDTMMVVWNRLDSFDGRSRFSTWLFGIAYRQAMTALRRLDEAIEGASDVPADREDDPDHSAAIEHSRRLLAVAVEQLSPAHRAVVELTYYQEFGYREIAQIMECPVDTVKTRMFHARKHLKHSLSGVLEDWI